MLKSPNRAVATLVGAVYLLAGLLGFAVTLGVRLSAVTDGLLLGLFGADIVHSAAHLIVGFVLVVAGLSSTGAAKLASTFIGAGTLALGVVGFFILRDTFAGLALTSADNALHFGSAVLLLAVGIVADNKSRAITI